MRILFVALPRSPHSIRHINLVAAQGWDVHVVPSYKAELLPELTGDVTVHRPWTGRAERARFASPIAWAPNYPIRKAPGARLMLDDLDVGPLVESVFPGTSAWAWWLANLVDRLRPDAVHSFTIQQAGYLTLAAKTILRDAFPPWIVGNWGIDIHFRGRFPGHEQGIRAVLSNCDYYTAECHRDVVLARRFSFEGAVLGVVPIGGGFDVQRLQRLRQPGPTSSRRLIMLKGYQGTVGRALVGLRAFELCADALQGFRVAVYLADAAVGQVAEDVSRSSGVPIEIVPYVPYEELMRLHGRARVSIGVSASDAISTSALEAMIMGSFPIQSNTSCLDEWVQDGESGLLIDPEDPVGLAAAIRRAVADDTLVDRAADRNGQLARMRLDQSVVGPQVVAMYDRVAADLRLCGRTVRGARAGDAGDARGLGRV